MALQRLVRLRDATIKNLDRVIKNYENSVATQISSRNALETVIKLYKTIEDNHEKIITTCDDKDEEGHLNIFCEVSDKFDNFRNVVESFLVDVKKHEESLCLSNLPAQRLPKFDGDPRSWTSFSNTFASMIGNNNNLTGIQRFRYLISCLEGQAKNTVSHIPETEEAFEVAWTLLKDRYQDKRFIIMNELNRLTSLTIRQDDLLTFVTEINEIVRKLEMLGEKTESWNSILLHIISKKLPTNLTDDFENSLPDDEIPPFNVFLKFIEKRAKTLYKKEMTNHSNLRPKFKTDNRVTQRCPQCKFDHTLDKCGTFLKLDTSSKWKIARDSKMCINCLRHSVNVKCSSEGKCRTCGKRHHTLLHFENQGNFTAHVQERENSTVLLATAMVNITTNKGSCIRARALLDSGAQISFITENLAQKVGNPLLTSNKKYKGINQESCRPTGEMEIIISGNNQEKIKLRPLVVKRLTVCLPEKILNISTFKDLALADPDYNSPGSIDMILGTDVYNDLLLKDRIHRPGHLSAQSTIFGWVISGPVKNNSPHEQIINHMTTWEENIKNFWELESVPNQAIFSEEEKICEELYLKYVYRQKDGRYGVRLPFKNDPPQLGNSRAMAVKRLESLEKRFHRSPDYADHYREVIHDYVNRGHLELVPVSEIDKPANYLPHHAVIKEESNTTKYRVVFDGSAKTTNGKSLNDELLNGGKLQLDIFYHLLRFRQNTIVLTADIEKMYRQIMLHPDDRKYQRILWRDHSKGIIKHYQLTTVTFGLKSAPFLAVRTLHQIADDYRQYSIASELLRNNFYVDNLLAGTDSEEEAKQIIMELNKVMSMTGFHLRQWACNNKNIMNLIPKDDTSTSDDREWNDFKTLGLLWNTLSDTFQYKIKLEFDKQLTKRTLLSIVAGIYDPLGCLSPITIRGKLLFQHLWTINLAWDDPLPRSVTKQIIGFLEDLQLIQDIKIPRHAILPDNEQTSLHLFTDASREAYSAVAYVKSSTNSKVAVHLLTSKTKVAPLKPTTIPKLELTAMVLATKLYREIKRVWTFDKVFAYSDSKIALSWIQSHPSRWTTFVANRVAEIQGVISASAWHYVSTTDNPADLPTRGCKVQDLLKNEFWWSGPSWLATEDFPSQNSEISSLEAEEIKTFQRKEEIKIFQIQAETDLLLRYSSFTKLQRILAFVLRWKNHKAISQLSLTTEELKNAENVIIKLAQRQFHADIVQLTKGKALSSQSALLSLSPFLDKNGILRVGGRLQNSMLPERHPAILPKGHVGRLLVEKAHFETLHGGPSIVLAQLRQKYWVIGGRQLARAVTHECPTCRRLAADTSNQVMAPLPAARVRPSRPFTNTAIDYAGPINLKAQGVRSTRTFKAYIVVFVCFATKAVHLDVVTDLTTSAFIAALRRFVARRGKPDSIYTDNGTNFTGAFKELQKLAVSHSNDAQVQEMLASQEISWKFMPPRAPHMGGLHEAAVKSMKRHLLRVVKDKLLNYEELLTILTQIESVLNSRPLSPLSDNPNDPDPLTPGHFLIGAPMNSPPDPPLNHLKENRLSRWQLVQKINQNFWSRWSKEYLNTLQAKSKWHTARNPISTGDLVIIKDPNTSPFSWRMGRVSQELPGKDGITRVVQIITKDSVITRNITSLIRLEPTSARGGRLLATQPDSRRRQPDETKNEAGAVI